MATYKFKIQGTDTNVNVEDGALQVKDSGTGNATQIQGIDVWSTAPTTGQVLKYNATTTQYETKADAVDTNATTIQGITVWGTAPTTGQVLKYNATSTQYETVADATDTNATTIQNIAVSATAPSAGEALIYNGTATQYDTTTVLQNVVEDTTPQLGGDLDLNEKSISIDLPDANTEYSATEKMTQTVDTNSVGLFSVLNKVADGNFDEADADAAATSTGQLAMALETGTGSKLVMTKGWAYATAWSWTVGPLYVSTVVGTLTGAPPTGNGDIQREAAYAHSANLIKFEPSSTYIEVIA